MSSTVRTGEVSGTEWADEKTKNKKLYWQERDTQQETQKTEMGLGKAKSDAMGMGAFA